MHILAFLSFIFIGITWAIILLAGWPRWLLVLPPAGVVYGVYRIFSALMVGHF